MNGVVPDVASQPGPAHTGPLIRHFELPSGRDAPAAARHLVRTTLTAEGLTERRWLDAAVVVASELVSNAVRHAGGCLSLDVVGDGDQVTIAVTDASPVLPARREAGEDGGRGLLLVEAFTTRWGAQAIDGKKCVWACLRPCP